MKLEIHEILAILIGIYLFSRWKPIHINYMKDNQNVHTNNSETSSGAQRGLIVFRGEP